MEPLTTCSFGWYKAHLNTKEILKYDVACDKICIIYQHMFGIRCAQFQPSVKTG